MDVTGNGAALQGPRRSDSRFDLFADRDTALKAVALDGCRRGVVGGGTLRVGDGAGAASPRLRRRRRLRLRWATRNIYSRRSLRWRSWQSSFKVSGDPDELFSLERTYAAEAGDGAATGLIFFHSRRRRPTRV